jgi:hypothetical protein
MKTSDCKRADATAAPPDPRKHVNYIQGMVLGADDLIQEFAYHQNQSQWLARDAIGYGTLSGLRVTFRNDRKVSVAPGTALSARGQLIRVTPEQCAGINDWLDLDKTKQELRKQGFALTGTEKLDAYVVLCFRDCQVDELPVPGEPCRCEDQAMAPSRILDDFRLELRLSPPAQREEDAIHDFVQWLRQIKVSDAPVGGSSLDDFLDAIRAAVQDRSSPLESPPDFLYGSPPQGLVMPAAQLCQYLRAALKLWVVELRPLWQAQWAERTGGGCGCHGDEQAKGQDAEECLLLAALDITLTGGQVATANDVGVNDSKRPFVVHLRMLQEMLLCGPCCGEGCNDRTFATVFALDDHTLRIWIHHPVPVTFDSSAVQLEIDDNPVTGFTITQVAPDGSPTAGGLNVFDLDLGASPPVPLQQLQRITIKLDTLLIAESGSPARALAEALRQGGGCYPDVMDGVAQVFGVVEFPPTSTSGVTDHGALTGLDDDDHPQYHTDARGDLRYAPINHSHNHASLTGLNADDHPQYLLVNGARALTGDLSAGTNKVTNLAAATTNGDAVRFEQAIKNGDTAGGDLRNTYPNPRVQALQGRAVAGNAPSAGDVLAWNSAANAGRGQWEPSSASGTGLQVSSGAVTFENVDPGEFRESPLIDSQIKEDEFAIILAVTGMESDQIGGLNSANFNDLDTMPPPYSSLYPINLPAPFLVASYEQTSLTGLFLIALRDSRGLRGPFGDEFKGPVTWHVRWWAIPKSLELPPVQVPRPVDVFAVHPEILLSALGLAPNRKLTVAKLASNFGVPAAKLKDVLTRLESQGLIKRTGNSITRL